MATKERKRSSEPRGPLFDESGWPVRHASMKEVAYYSGLNLRKIERAKDLYDQDPDGKDDKLRLRFERFGRDRRMKPAILADFLGLDREEAA